MLIQSYNVTNFDTTLEFYGDGKLLRSYRLTPESIPFDIEVNVDGVAHLKINVCDSKAVSGGTSFGLTQMQLSGGQSGNSSKPVSAEKYAQIVLDNESVWHDPLAGIPAMDGQAGKTMKKILIMEEILCLERR